MTRAFLAIELPDPVRLAIAAACEPLRLMEPHLRWTCPENLHLTLKFLGEIESSRADRVADSLISPFSTRSSLRIEGGQGGLFSERGHPRVLWLGVGRGEAELVALAQVVEKTLIPLGFHPEPRRFQAHLTVARIEEGHQPGPAFFEKWREMESFRFGEVRVESVTLFRSDLSPEGPKYTPMRTLALGRRNA